MKTFLDTNVWISAFATKGLARELVTLVLDLNASGELTLLISDAVQQETARVLREKFGLDPAAIDTALDVQAMAATCVPATAGLLPTDIPDPDDAPILAAALAAGADLFVTGDKALLALGAVESMPIVEPRAAYLKLRGLA
ncbi:MAG: putative toxin-antitoxin system toxin component, PIN family [Tepidimonas ignava]